MAFEIPTLRALVTRTAAAFRANLKGSDAALWPNNVAVTAKVIAGAVWEPFAFLEYISRQILVHTADGDWLERHGYDYGITRLPASYARGRVTLTGTNGTLVPAGLVLQRADGVRYMTTSGGTVASGVVEVAVSCDTVGRTGNAAGGVTLALIGVFPGLTLEHTVAASGIGGGADTESDESLRARILFRKRMPPRGGARHDYVAWARDVAGVTRVFVDAVTVTNGRSSVGVWFMMDDAYADGLPQSADVAIVAAYIDTVRPAGARVDVAAPVPVAINITISGLTPDTATVRSAVYAELADLFRREGRVSTTEHPATVYRSKIWESVSAATGEDHHTVSAPASDTVLGLGRIAVLGTVTFV